jgi:hypothetical protein
MQFGFLFHFFHINQQLKAIIKIIRTNPRCQFFVLFLRVI